MIGNSKKPHRVDMPYKLNGKTVDQDPSQTMDPESWLDLFEHMCSLTDPGSPMMSQEQKLRALFRCLEGAALAIAITQPLGSPYDKVMGALRTLLVRRDLATSALDKLNDMRQEQGQTVEAFHLQYTLAYARVVKTSNRKFALPTEMRAQKFRDALLPDIASPLGLFSEITTYENMVAKALSIERTQEQQRSKFQARLSARLAAAPVEQRFAPRRRDQGRDRPAPTCWSCGLPGHRQA
jgi:hypothetical protein